MPSNSTRVEGRIVYAVGDGFGRDSLFRPLCGKKSILPNDIHVRIKDEH